MEQKKLGKGNNQPARNNDHGIIETMKPFVTFGLKAMAVLGSALIYIVKNIPKPGSHQPSRKNDKVIKI